MNSLILREINLLPASVLCFNIGTFTGFSSNLLDNLITHYSSDIVVKCQHQLSDLWMAAFCCCFFFRRELTTMVVILDEKPVPLRVRLKVLMNPECS